MNCYLNDLEEHPADYILVWAYMVDWDSSNHEDIRVQPACISHMLKAHGIDDIPFDAPGDEWYTTKSKDSTLYREYLVRKL